MMLINFEKEAFSVFIVRQCSFFHFIISTSLLKTFHSWSQVKVSSVKYSSLMCGAVLRVCLLCGK